MGLRAMGCCSSQRAISSAHKGGHRWPLLLTNPRIINLAFITSCANPHIALPWLPMSLKWAGDPLAQHSDRAMATLAPTQMRRQKSPDPSLCPAWRLPICFFSRVETGPGQEMSLNSPPGKARRAIGDLPQSQPLILAESMVARLNGSEG